MHRPWLIGAGRLGQHLKIPRQPHGKDAAAAGSWTGRVHLPAVQVDEFFDQCQPDAQPALLPIDAALGL